MSIITLADGRKFDTAKRELVREQQEPIAFLPAPRTGIRLEDLPVDKKQMNAVCAIAAYELIGIDENDIAFAFGCTVEDIRGIKASDAYQYTVSEIQASFVRGQNDTARAILAGASIEAAQIVVEKMRDGRSALKAAESVLNRVGISDDAANTGGMAQGLTIKIVKDSGPTKVEVSINGR